jgi:hypothetical protein
MTYLGNFGSGAPVTELWNLRGFGSKILNDNRDEETAKMARFVFTMGKITTSRVKQDAK